MNAETRVQTLLQVAEDYRREHCEALLAGAHEDTSRRLAAAHAAARRALRAALGAQREQLANDLAAAEAKLVTARRLREQRRLVTILRQAWPRLVRTLRGRWESRAGRAAWVAQHLAVARRALPDGPWTLQHPQDWPSAERDQAALWLRARGIDTVRFEPDAALRAGIRVVCGLNVLDASLEGLLAERAQVEGRLLHFLAQPQ